jgi:hypothetical protein
MWKETVSPGTRNVSENKSGNSAGNLSKDIRSLDPDFNPETPKYEAGILPIGKPRAVSSCCFYGPN